MDKNELILYTSFEVIQLALDIRLKEKHLRYFNKQKLLAENGLWMSTLACFEESEEHELLDFASFLFSCGEKDKARKILKTVYQIKLEGQRIRIKDLQEMLAHIGIYLSHDQHSTQPNLAEMMSGAVSAVDLWIEYLLDTYSSRNLTLCNELFAVFAADELDNFERALSICLAEHR